jgi:hypothetical protein
MTRCYTSWTMCRLHPVKESVRHLRVHLRYVAFRAIERVHNQRRCRGSENAKTAFSFAWQDNSYWLIVMSFFVCLYLHWLCLIYGDAVAVSCSVQYSRFSSGASWS